jgi:hypothetical protein
MAGEFRRVRGVCGRGGASTCAQGLWRIRAGAVSVACALACVCAECEGHVQNECEDDSQSFFFTPLASPCSGIVVYLSTSNIHVLTRTLRNILIRFCLAAV